MANEKKALNNSSVKEMIKDLEDNPSTRFSKSDFHGLIYAILSDKDFKAKKYVIKNGELAETEYDNSAAMAKFLDKLLRHAGMSEATERTAVLETFEFGARDVEWIAEAVDEAMFIYSESGKNMKVFRDKMINLAFKKIVRTGKYAGKISYKKTVTDRVAAQGKTKG